MANNKTGGGKDGKKIPTASPRKRRRKTKPVPIMTAKPEAGDQGNENATPNPNENIIIKKTVPVQKSQSPRKTKNTNPKPAPPRSSRRRKRSPGAISTSEQSFIAKKESKRNLESNQALETKGSIAPKKAKDEVRVSRKKRQEVRNDVRNETQNEARNTEQDKNNKKPNRIEFPASTSSKKPKEPQKPKNHVKKIEKDDKSIIRFTDITGENSDKEEDNGETMCSIFTLSDEQKEIFYEEWEDLENRRIVDLVRLAKIAGLTEYFDMNREELMVHVAMARLHGQAASVPLSSVIDGGGVVEIMQDGYGFLRSAKYNYLPSPSDVYVSPSQIKKFGLRNGDTIDGDVRPPKDQEKFYALVQIDSINYGDPEDIKGRRYFDTLTPLFPEERITLETHRSGYSMRIVDMLAPIGKGQRGLIVSPPKSGKTILLKDIANSVTQNHPEVKLIVLLVDERPEEVTDMERSVTGDVVASTFDEPPDKHVQVAEMVLHRSKRLVEAGHDVVVLLDSITRLARAHNTVVPHSGKILSGGVDARAMQMPKRFFGAARNIENGGSLTIMATALIDTGSRMDEVIFEEFKGTGNMELVLDRKLADRRIFPAIDVNKSGTRREDLLYTPLENSRIWILRKILGGQQPVQAMDFLIDRVKSSSTNQEFFNTMNS